MLTVKLSPDLDARLDKVAARLGRSKQDVALQAIAEEIEDLKDGFVALERSQDTDVEFSTLEGVRERLDFLASKSFR